MLTLGVNITSLQPTTLLTATLTVQEVDLRAEKGRIQKVGEGEG